MMAWLMNLISGWLPIGVNSTGQPKPFGEWAGKILWVVGIVLLVLFATNLINLMFPQKQNVTTVTAGGTQIIQQAEPRDTLGFGCNIMKLYVKGGMKAK